MRIRIKFCKQGNVRFLGHLDVMRYFQKAIRRAGIDVKFSSGYSPHQIMSFASPLGVGMEGIGEYLDIEVNSITSSLDMVQKLNEQMAEGFHVLSAVMLSEEAVNGMAAVAAASYVIKPGTMMNPENYAGACDYIQRFLSREEMMIEKEGKKGTVTFDLKSGIIQMYQNTDRSITLLLSSGSRLNIHPKQVMKALFDYAQIEYEEADIRILRTETYMEKENGLFSLESDGVQF